MLHCSKSQFTCVLVLYTSITASPLHLPWARQGMWALCCESDKQDKSSPAGPGPLLLLCQSTGLASASFQKCPFEVLSFCQACRCLAAQLEIVRRWRANSLDGCEVLKKGNWIIFLSRSCTVFCVLASPPCISGNVCLVCQIVQFGTGLSTGSMQYDHYRPSVHSSFLYLQQWKSNGGDIEGFFKHFFPEKVSLLMCLLCYTRHF